MEMRLFKQASKPCRSLAEQFPALAQCTGLLHIPAPDSPPLTSFLSGLDQIVLSFNPGRIAMSEHLLSTERELQKSLFDFFLLFFVLF